MTNHSVTFDALMTAHEKLSAARRALMLPRPSKQIDALATAFYLCSLGLPRESDVHYAPAREWIRVIRKAMDTTGIPIETGYDVFHGGSRLKADLLLQQRNRHRKRAEQDGCSEFCGALDELIEWVARELEFIARQLPPNVKGPIVLHLAPAPQG